MEFFPQRKGYYTAKSRWSLPDAYRTTEKITSSILRVGYNGDGDNLEILDGQMQTFKLTYDELETTYLRGEK